MSNFHPLEVVGRGSKTQVQVDENLNYLIQRFWAKRFLIQMDRTETENETSSG